MWEYLDSNDGEKEKHRPFSLLERKSIKYGVRYAKIARLKTYHLRGWCALMKFARHVELVQATVNKAV